MRGIKRLISAVALFAVLVGAQTSLATGNYNKPAKVAICHATNSENNPYVRITVSVSAVDGIAGNSGQQADHFGEHTGPVFDPAVHSQKNRGWGDIIPPLKGVHQGLNWTSVGIAIWKNGCKSPVKPAQPPDKIVFGQLTDGAKSCETKTVTQTRTKSVTTFVWNGQMWVEGTTTVTTETSSRPMTEAELKECVVPPVCVSPAVRASMTITGQSRVGYLKYFTQTVTVRNTGKYSQRYVIRLSPRAPRLTFGDGSTKSKTIKVTLKPGAKKTITVGLRPTKVAYLKWVYFDVRADVFAIAPKGVRFCPSKGQFLGATRRIWEP